MTIAIISLIRLYQRSLSLLLPNVCRFSPTCSEYMAQAIAKHGIARGGFMGLYRIMRCQPFSTGGYDPIP